MADPYECFPIHGGQRGPHARSRARRALMAPPLQLAHVAVIVWMHRLLRADNSTKHLDGEVGDYLIEIHVRPRARAGLKDHQREMIVQVTRGCAAGESNAFCVKSVHPRATVRSALVT